MGNNSIKYIVYETTNLINNKIYIGVHHTTKPYEFDKYLGCGVISTQSYTYENAKTAFQYAVKKHGPQQFKRKTLAVFNSLEEAFALERELVNEDFVAREDTYNMVLGGASGLYESGKKKVFQYDLDGTFLAEFNSFCEAGIFIKKDYTAVSYAVKFKSKCGGYYWSTDKLDILDLNLYNQNFSGNMPLNVYKKSGEFYKTFDKFGDAKKELSINTSILREACITGLLINDLYYFCYFKAEFFDMARKKYLKSRKVYQYDFKTNQFIAEYKNQYEAEKQHPKSNISKSIRLKTDDGCGFRWLAVKTDSFKSNLNKHRGKKVYKKENETIVKIYESAAAAVKANGASVWSALSKGKPHKGFMYCYAES